MTASTPNTPTPGMSAELSARLRFWSLVSMVLLVYVHAFNLHPRYLAPMTLVDEAPTWDHVLQFLIANGLTRFRIPMLFAISGYLLAWRDDGSAPHGPRITKRLRTLGIPYLAWSAIALGITAALELWQPTREIVRAAGLSSYGPDHPFVTGYTAGQLLTRWLLDPSAFQLWFLRTLLILTALYPWLRRAVVRKPAILFTIATVAWLLFETSGLLFFSLGIWLAVRRVDVVAKPTWMRPAAMLAVWLVLCSIKTWMAFTVETMSEPVAMTMLLLHRGGEATGMLAAWYGMDGLARAAMQQRAIRWLSQFSFVIYALHVPMVNYVTEAALLVGAGRAHVELWVYLLVPVLVIAVTVVVGALLRGTMPSVYRLLTGGRGLADGDRSLARAVAVTSPASSLQDPPPSPRVAPRS
jgi:fucose 4-O-acetylase-like acetyltransferase